MSDSSKLPEAPTHRDVRPDHSRTGPLPGSGKVIQRINGADARASLLMLVGMTLSSAAVLWSSHGTGYARPPGLLWMAGLAWAIFAVGLFAIWEERFRHGLSRDLFAAGAAVLVVCGFLYLDRVGLVRLLLSTWIPAAIALWAAFVSGQAQEFPRAPHGPLRS